MSTDSYDAGLWLDLSVIKRLPHGAVLGYPTGPKQPVRSKLKSADIVVPERSEDRVVTMPADYEGQVRQVIVWATTDSTGALIDATAGRQPDGTSLVTDLDSLAIRAVRGWRFIPSLDCAGRPTRSTVGFTVRFGR